MPSKPPSIRAPRGRKLTCKSWVTEAALRMLMNNLDPEVAERPADLVVYGGRGKAARNWKCFDALVDVRSTEGSGMAFRRLIVDCGVGPLHLHGFRPMVNSREHHAWFIAHGGHAHVDGAPVALPPAPGHLFASFDLDVIDMAHAPGVSAPNPSGWTTREAERWVLACGADPRVRCFDLMELCPPCDEGGRTARLAAHLFLTFLTGFATRP